MTSRRPTKVEQFAIEAKLNLILGAEVYDRVFQGFEVLEVVNGESNAGNEARRARATCVSNFGSQHRYRELKFGRRVPVTVGR
jgi:hypothetical protein